MTLPPRRTARRRAATLIQVLLAATLVASGLVVTTSAQAVSVQHGDRMVSEVPASFTPHVVDGSVNAFVQVGSKMFAAGTFTAVRQTPTGPDIPRAGLFAFDAETGVIDPGFDPVLGGTANSLDTDGTHVYVGGAFGSVGGSTRVRRVVKLTTSGAVVSQFKALPSAAVNEVVVRGNRLFVAGQFVSVSGTAANGFAVLDATTGAVLNGPEVPFAGTYNGGSTSIVRMDVDPAGTRVVAIGNFTTVAGLPREQMVLLDAPVGGAVTVSSWATARMSRARNAACSKTYQAWMRDVDIAADGSYFVVTTTGAFGDGATGGSMCDTTSRWELGGTGSGQEPTWVTYTGGDTSYGVAITGGVVYTGGHFRWQNNAFQGDQAGPGAVSREGVAALDAVNGMPLSWNPGRTRGVGAQALYATTDGLWVGSDTERFNNRLRMRIAFLPLRGGTTLPVLAAPSLPGDLYAATPSGSTPGVLWRINAGGQPTLQSGDSGPGWVNESGRVTGGTNVNYTAVATTEPAVPAGTPATVFSSERTGAQAYSLPTTFGRPLTVRLYFANQSSSTALPGQRKFDVTLDGRLVLDDFDVVAATGGTRKGTVRSFDITSDGFVNVGLSTVLGSPLINAIEVVDRSVAGTPVAPGALVRRPMTTAAAPADVATVVDTGMDWSRVRGLASTGGTIYYGLPDGGIHARAFDPVTGAVGAERTIDLHDDPEDGRRIPVIIPNLTGLTFDPSTHRLYYTLFNDARLYYRYFSPESEIVGAQTFVADPGTTTSFATATGLALADGRLLYGSTADGALRAVPLTRAGLGGPATVVSTDGSWRHRGMFVATAAANRPPLAEFTASCDDTRTCTFDATRSTDTDGEVAAYSWDLGDGSPAASGRQTTHTYAADGDYAVTLSVTDDRGAVGTRSQGVSVTFVPPPNQPPTASFTVSCTDLTCRFDASSSSDPDGSLVAYAWTFGDGTGAPASSGATVSHTYTTAGRWTAGLVVTDDRGVSADASRELTASEPVAGEIAFRAAATMQGNVVTASVAVPAGVQPGDAIVLSLTQNADRPVSAPPGAGWTSHGTVAGDQIRTTTWSRVAQAGDVGSTVSLTQSARTKVTLSLLAYSGTSVTSPVLSYAATPETVLRAAHTTPGAVAVPSGSWVVSGWSDMTSATTDWSEPEGETIRTETIGEGSGRISTLVTDRGPVPGGDQPGRTATADSAGAKALSWTLVLTR